MDGQPQFSQEPGAAGEAGGTGFPARLPRMPARLSKKAKAAIIVRLLAAQEVKLPLATFPEEMQVELAHQMTGLRYIDKATLAAVVEEFLAELEAIGLSFPGGLEGALSVLDGTISPTTASRLRKNAGVSLTGDPWERVAEVDVSRLLPILTEESVEIGAVLLSKLKVAKAAQLMSMLPGERARRVAYAISLTSGVSPEVVQRIGMSIAARLEAQPAQAFPDGPPERVGAILNFSSATTRDGVLEGLAQTDSDFAEEVRRNIFTYANIATRVDPRDISKIVRGVEQDVLIRALAGAQGEAAAASDFILSNMSKRMADSLREEIEALGQVKESEAEEAMNAVVAVVRDLETRGELFLLTGED
ncbi:flagellar motor switch protein FliG [Celeribacter indicus]|uniref:Flagellar motor switch protein FliG n=1 Tax=Celeribacter indicus TaxID=1208324 RepID=A0A0B5E1K9_9RHOB|nr:FliG C-terminal domain-containing protein [Celeribacter indicus]AJE46352.1 flagellar motor switch protein FliG [Celeribacter indicus]SDW54251.1 flagellar motor switch protein FliG [Celeribacter indicus]